MRFLFLIITVLLVSCSHPKTPRGIIEPEKMQAVLWDYMRADIYANENLRIDSTVKNIDLESARLQQQLFAAHKVTKDEFYNSLNYYLQHRDMLKEVLDTMLIRQDRIANAPPPGSDSMLTRHRPDTGILKKDSGKKKLPFNVNKLDSIKKSNE
ncbi:MAG: DUF4296 domain-containing protein [Ferruginibacter sp.]